MRAVYIEPRGEQFFIAVNSEAYPEAKDLTIGSVFRTANGDSYTITGFTMNYYVPTPVYCFYGVKG